MSMRKAAPWIAVGAGVAFIALLAVHIVIVSKLRAKVSALVAEVQSSVATAPPHAPAALPVENNRKSNQTDASDGEAMGGGGDEAVVLAPPPGTLVATFDESVEGWSCPDWASGSVLHATQPDMPRRGGGALALGYVYSDTQAAAAGPVSPGGKLKQIRFYARTRAREMVLGIGVVEEGGARYELKVPALKPDEGWRLVSVPPSSMGPAKGSRDADRKLDLARIVSIYVLDRTKDAAGGNVLLIDDLTIELFE